MDTCAALIKVARPPGRSRKWCYACLAPLRHRQRPVRGARGMSRRPPTGHVHIHCRSDTPPLLLIQVRRYAVALGEHAVGLLRYYVSLCGFRVIYTDATLVEAQDEDSTR
jgi:hypothetical protein